jgi:hypothetical protein
MTQYYNNSGSSMTNSTVQNVYDTQMNIIITPVAICQILQYKMSMKTTNARSTGTV